MLIYELTVDAAANQNHEFHGQTAIPVLTFWNFTVSLHWSTFTTNLISSITKIGIRVALQVAKRLST